MNEDLQRALQEYNASLGSPAPQKAKRPFKPQLTLITPRVQLSREPLKTEHSDED